LGPQQLRFLKPTAILVNVARGRIIDENALIETLENERIFGAGLDVFEEEPLSPSNPLRRFENVVLTSHIGSSTEKAFGSTWVAAVGNILRFVKGEKPYWIVNPSVLNARRSCQ
jgi:phosphogluconate 2-dehydrogenase